MKISPFSSGCSAVGGVSEKCQQFVRARRYINSRVQICLPKIYRRYIPANADLGWRLSVEAYVSKRFPPTFKITR
jgi:hypothetical protein